MWAHFILRITVVIGPTESMGVTAKDVELAYSRTAKTTFVLAKDVRA